MSANPKIPWCDILLEKYKEKLNWKSISFWTETKFTEEIISKFENKFKPVNPPSDSDSEEEYDDEEYMSSRAVKLK